MVVIKGNTPRTFISRYGDIYMCLPRIWIEKAQFEGQGYQVKRGWTLWERCRPQVGKVKTLGGRSIYLRWEKYGPQVGEVQTLSGKGVDLRWEMCSPWVGEVYYLGGRRVDLRWQKCRSKVGEVQSLSQRSGGRPTTTISTPSHVLLIFSSKPPRNPRPFKNIFFVQSGHVREYNMVRIKFCNDFKMLESSNP